MTFNAREISKKYCAGALTPLLLASGCFAYESDSSADPANIEGVEAPIIGGFEANSPALNAIGSISVLSGDSAGMPVFTEQCTGVLIGPRTVLTAKHCLAMFTVAAEFNETLVFGIGPDARMPQVYAAVIDTAGAPGDEGGYMNRGRDVGVMRLDREITNIRFVGLREISDAEVGHKFVAIGFGAHSNGDNTPLRRMGALTLRARAGLTYEILYGSFEAFYRAQTASPPPTGCPAPGEGPPVDEVCAFAARLRNTYESTRLEQVGELAVGGLPGEAQPCYGDSGGPLLRVGEGGELLAYGVAVGGVSSEELICDHGGIYAGFGSEVMGFLMNELAWRDPCEGLPATGTCEGDLARRCSTAAEGRRRVIEADCSLVGMRCIASPTGATCDAAAAR